jgi:hypothetical protein
LLLLFQLGISCLAAKKRSLLWRFFFLFIGIFRSFYATVSLIFFASYRQAPFFVLDEVDAALDNVNVKKVCSYIKQRSKDFQCIVISLKDIFFEHSDALIGICRDQQRLELEFVFLFLLQHPNLSLVRSRCH